MDILRTKDREGRDKEPDILRTRNPDTLRISYGHPGCRLGQCHEKSETHRIEAPRGAQWPIREVLGCRSWIRFGTRTASSYSARSVGGWGQTRGVVVVGEKWAHVVRTPPDRKVVGAGPVGSGHGSYQLVSWWGGQCWCPPMAHAQWWQSGSAIRDVATTNAPLAEEVQVRKRRGNPVGQKSQRSAQLPR